MFGAQADFSRLAEVVRGLGLHEHLCLIYDTREEQFAAALPYLKIGLERGEKCLYVVDENTAAAVLDALRRGVEFREDDGHIHISAPAQVRLLAKVAGGARLALTIHEGRKRQVRRMLASVGYPVQHLTRVAIGPLTLNDLPPGKWRYLVDSEVTSLLSL